MLIGDAAGFIDPFTGEGIYRALRSARAAAESLDELDEGASDRYLAARRRAFAAKDALTWLVQGMLASPPLMGYALRRLAARPATAERLGSALGRLPPGQRRPLAALPGAGPAAMKSRVRIHVDAPLERIFPLAAEVERWPERLPHYRYVHRLPGIER